MCSSELEFYPKIKEARTVKTWKQRGKRKKENDERNACIEVPIIKVVGLGASQSLDVTVRARRRDQTGGVLHHRVRLDPFPFVVGHVSTRCQ